MSPNYPACYVIVKKGSKVLFVLRENTGFMDGNYSLPAGRVEKSESFSAGAAREASEEVGLNLDKAKFKHVFTMHRHYTKVDRPDWVDIFFEISAGRQRPRNVEADKHSRIEWLDINDLPDNVMDYQKFALEQINKGLTYGEFGWQE